MYKLSVIIPVYNTMPWLRACLDAVEAQTVFEQTQVVLVDDGSHDDSPAVCDSFADAHANTVVIHQKNAGVSAARNAGIAAAQGEFLGFVDSDDIVEDNYYERLLNAADSVNADMAFGGISLLQGDQLTAKFEGSIKPGTVLRGDEIADVFARNMLTDTQLNSVCHKILRRSTVVDNGIVFPVGVRIAEDRCFVLRFLKHCSCAVSVGGCGYYYREVQTSAMHTAGRANSASFSFDEEIALFAALGLDKQTVVLGKSTHLFDIFVDSMHQAAAAPAQAKKELIKAKFADRGLMSSIDPCLDFILSDRGTVYKLYARAIKKRSVPQMLLAMSVQKKINR